MLSVNLKQKLLLSIMTISVVIFLIFSFLLYRQSADAIEQNYVNMVTGNMDVCAAAFDNLMREAYFTAVDAANDERLPELLAQQKYTDIEGYLGQYLTGDIDTVYCYIYGHAQLVRATRQGTQTERCPSDKIIWVHHTANEIRSPLMPVSTTDRLGTIRKNIFAYEQPVAAPDDTRILGYVIVTVDERTAFFKCLQNRQSGSDGEIYITTPEGRYASCSNLNRLGEPEEKIGEHELKSSIQAPLTGYGFHSVVNRDVLTGDIRRAGSRILLFSVLLLLLSGVSIWVIVRNMLTPLQQLEEAMQQVSRGDLTIQTEVYQNDEIGRLAADFNSMVRQLDSLIGELVTQKMLKREAEMEALQYQIQPHFIYNTLNTIKYAAILQNAKEIAQLLEAFIELMQLTARNQGTFIPLERELHMVDNYVRLQMFRYANSFEVEYDIQPETKRCYIPNLLIQPLVENAILHGIDLKKENGRIEISAMQIGDTLAVRVQDNGRGLSQEEMQNLMTGQKRSKFSGIGIGNVRERLRLYYGTRAELRFHSENGSGTTAVITLPVSYDENEYTI